MNPLTQFKKIPVLPILIALGLVAFASPPVAHADAVLDWNGYAADAIVGGANMPAARGIIRLAMVHVAIYDAVNAIEGYPFTPTQLRRTWLLLHRRKLLLRRLLTTS